MNIIDELKLLIKNGSLNIANRNLTELPESDIWKEVKYLNCSNNNLARLPNLPSVVKLICTKNVLIELPKMPLITDLCCDFNKLTKLTELPLVVSLNCEYNNLTELPYMPNIRWLNCSNNYLTRIPNFENIIILHCSTNLLTMLPEVPNAIVGTYCNNRFHYNPKYRIKMALIYKFTLAVIAVRRWRKNAMKRVSEYKTDLHNELLYSPDLPFYLQTTESRHWFEMVIKKSYERKLINL